MFSFIHLHVTYYKLINYKLKSKLQITDRLDILQPPKSRYFEQHAGEFSAVFVLTKAEI